MKSIAWNAMSVTVISTAFENVAFFLQWGKKKMEGILKLYMAPSVCNL